MIKVEKISYPNFKLAEDHPLYALDTLQRIRATGLAIRNFVIELPHQFNDPTAKELRESGQYSLSLVHTLIKAYQKDGSLTDICRPSVYSPGDIPESQKVLDCLTDSGITDETLYEIGKIFYSKLTRDQQLELSQTYQYITDQLHLGDSFDGKKGMINSLLVIGLAGSYIELTDGHTFNFWPWGRHSKSTGHLGDNIYDWDEAKTTEWGSGSWGDDRPTFQESVDDGDCPSDAADRVGIYGYDNDSGDGSY